MWLVIIIPTYNRRNFLTKLLSQIKRQLLLLNVNIKVVVVNDGSSDCTEEILIKNFNEVNIIKGDGNWWYTKSMNEGFKYAIENFNPDFFLTLNDDLELDEKYLDSMINSVNVIGNERIVGSLSLTAELPRRVTSSGVYKKNNIFGKSYSYHKFLEIVDLDKLKGLHKSIMLPGRGMLIPAKILIDLDYFDEKFPQYHSDIDFCLRAIKKGYKLFVNWDAKLYSYYKETSISSSYQRKSLATFLKSFSDIHSRNHLLQNMRLFWRHYNKIAFPLLIIIFSLTKVKHFLKIKFQNA